MRRYSRKQREKAAQQLSMLACQALWELTSQDVGVLARLACSATWPRGVTPFGVNFRIAYAEAEAFIRCGWSPDGDA